MQTVIALALLAPAAAFVQQAPVQSSSALAAFGGSKKVGSAKDELIALAESNPDSFGASFGFWDPLGAADYNFWGMGNEATIGYLRHAEIKHGRVAMAGFLGFCAQSTPLVSGEHAFAPYKGYVAGCSPQEQWDNIPLYGKLQIITLVGMLESYGEGAGSPEGYVHYTKGGKPGYYPPIKGKGLGQIQFDLFDPFKIQPVQTEEEKVRGLKCEVNNGRLAMIGLLGCLSESSTPGSVPALSGFESFPKYAGDVMVPFSSDFSFF